MSSKLPEFKQGEVYEWVTHTNKDTGSHWKVINIERDGFATIECVKHKYKQYIGMITPFYMQAVDWKPVEDPFDTWVKEVRANHDNGGRAGRGKGKRKLAGSDRASSPGTRGKASARSG